MGEDPVQRYSGAGLYPQAPLDEVSALSRQTDAELDLRRADLFVLLEGDVAADHVVEEDTQRPHGGRRAMISVQTDPFWRRIHSRTWKRDMNSKKRRVIIKMMRFLPVKRKYQGCNKNFIFDPQTQWKILSSSGAQWEMHDMQCRPLLSLD